MIVSKAFQANWKLDIARPDDVLNLEVHELGGKPELLHDTRILSRSKAALFLAFCARADHLSRRKDEGRGLRFANAHNHGSESLRVVLCVSGVEGNCLQVEFAPKITG